MQEFIGDIVPIYNTGADMTMEIALMDAYRTSLLYEPLVVEKLRFLHVY